MVMTLNIDISDRSCDTLTFILSTGSIQCVYSTGACCCTDTAGENEKQQILWRIIRILVWSDVRWTVYSILENKARSNTGND